LLLAWTAGPLGLAFLVLCVFAVLGWPRTPLMAYFIPGLPVLAGTVCFVIQTRPTRLQWLTVIPYAIGCAVTVVGASIVMGFLMGAPK